MSSSELEEQKRREDYLRAYRRPLRWEDPFTWPYPYKTAAATATGTSIGFFFYNLYFKRPFYFGIVPAIGAIATVGLVGFGAGLLREHHYRTRDAVLEHYISLHPKDFDHLKDFKGRPYSQILLPWYPKRTEYTKYD